MLRKVVQEQDLYNICVSAAFLEDQISMKLRKLLVGLMHPYTVWFLTSL